MSTLEAVSCVDGGQVIPEARLVAVPRAVRCLERQSRAEEKPSPREVLHPCSICGNKLVWRYRKNGTADYFIGCTNFPRCRYTE
jgi:hypothetical protein